MQLFTLNPNKLNAISNDQKREICQYKKENPKIQFEKKTLCSPVDLEEFLQFDNNGETGI